MAGESVGVQFPINQSLLDEAEKLRQERSTMAERMAKIEATKDQVSPQVYNRVCGEYREKFEEVTKRLLEKKSEIDRELTVLHDTRKKVTANYETQKSTLEELEFRKQLGEFDDAEFNTRSLEAKDKLSKFQKIVEAINNNIKKYEELFSDFSPAPMEASQPTPVAVKPPATKPSTGSTATMAARRSKSTAKGEYHLPDEKSQNYFASGDDVSERPTGIAPPPAPPPTQRTQVYVPGQETTLGAPQVSSRVSKSTEPGVQHGTAYLTVTRGASDNPKYPLGKETTIGRAHTNHIVLKEARISRQHAIIRQAGKEYVLEDLQSSNGVYINGERLKEHVLSSGDQIQIGDFVMEFHQ